MFYLLLIGLLQRTISFFQLQSTQVQDCYRIRFVPCSGLEHPTCPLSAAGLRTLLISLVAVINARGYSPRPTGQADIQFTPMAILEFLRTSSTTE